MNQNLESSLDLADLELDPIAQFTQWYHEALNSKLLQPDAVTLATATKDGRPSARIVLHKGIHSGGFCFYTNYHSPKANELDANPKACLVFFWPSLVKQIRVEGDIKRLTRKESETYFQTRPRDSCLGAWASEQSTKIENFDILEKRMSEFRTEFEGREVPCPPHWGGYVLIPNRVEFWCGRKFRLHDRFVYEKNANQSNAQDKSTDWVRSRLSP